MSITVNMMLTSATSLELLDAAIIASKEQVRLMSEVSISLRQKTHSVKLPDQVIENQTPMEKTVHQTGQYEFHLLADHKLHINWKSGSNIPPEISSDVTSFTTYEDDLQFFYRQEFHNLFFSAVQNKYVRELMARIKDFAKEEFFRTKGIPFYILVDVAINRFEEFVVKHEHKDDLDRCSICLEEFKEDDKGLIKTPCSHVFHGQCIVDWFRATDSCPICRHEFAISLYDDDN